MKLQRLKIQNIASIETADIDFVNGPLSSDPIFLISGDTGTGKSTILNAICLALYDKVPALEAIGSSEMDRDEMQTDNTRQLMRKGSVWAFVELYFMGDDEKRYMAKWEVQRARKKQGGKVQALVRQLQNLDTGLSITFKREIDNEIKRIVGLSFEQFTRTTMLAQGQFATFMKAADKDKADILEKLTGTEIYSSIGKQINQAFNEKKTACELLDAQIKAVKLLSDEQKSECQESISKLKAELEMFNAQYKLLDDRYKWMERKMQVEQMMQAKQTAVEQALMLSQSEEVTALRENLELWDNTADVRRHLVDVEAVEEQLAQLHANMQQFSGVRWHAILDGLCWLQDACQRKMPQPGALEAQRQQLQHCEDMAKANDMAKITDEIAALLSNLKKVTDGIAALKIFQTLRTKHKETEAMVADAQRKKAEDEKQLEKYTQHLPDLQKEYDRLSAIAQGHMELQDHIVSMRKLFSASKHCPLCGNEDAHFHDDAFITDRVAEAIDAANQAKQRLEKCGAAIAAAKAVLATDIKTLAVRQSETAKYQRELVEAEVHLQGHVADYEGEDAMRRLQDQERQMTQEHQSLLSKKTEAQKALTALAAARKTFDEMLACQHQAEIMQGRIKTLLSDTESLSLRFASSYEPKPIKHDDLEEKLRTLSHDVISNDTAIANLKKQSEELHASIEAWIAEHHIGYVRIKDLARIRPEQMDVARKQVLSVDQNLANAQTELAVLKQQSLEHEQTKPEMPEGCTIETIAAERAALEEKRDSCTIEQAKISAMLETDAQAKACYASDLQKLEALRADRNEWGRLEDLFGTSDGSRFRRVAQSYVLQALLAKANYYLRMFSPRYCLDCDDGSLTINVIDQDHNDTVRNVGLLSGGESFVVSLSLALGLSAISKQHINVDTLFIDEGFGTLDATVLDTVITVLDRLHSIGGRRIGIISHVQELKDRITTQLCVERTGPSTSRVELRSQS